MTSVTPYIKNQTQKIRQLMSKWFPGYIRKSYFKELDQAIAQFPEKVLTPENEILFISELIPKNATVLDIGANKGIYVYALNKSKKCKEIHALEPIPELNRQLKNLFPGIKVYNEAISDITGKHQFRIPYINSRYFDTRGTLESYTESEQTGTRTIEVETISLDQFILKYEIQNVDLIKMDIEGHEYAALSGAINTLKNLRPVWLIEIEQRHHANLPIRDIFSFIEKFDYRGYYFDGILHQFLPIIDFKTHILQLMENMNIKEKYINNFLFVPAEKDKEFTEIFYKISKQFK